MLSEDFDKRIREAADHHHPPYDEKAWRAMKRLLEKYLPEEKGDRKRFLFLLLLLLLLGSGAWFFFGRGLGSKNEQELAANRVPGYNLQSHPANKTTEQVTQGTTPELPVPGMHNEPPGKSNNSTGNQINNMVDVADPTPNSGLNVSGRQNVKSSAIKKNKAGPDNAKSVVKKQTGGKEEARTSPVVITGSLTQPNSADTKDKGYIEKAGDKEADKNINKEPAANAENSEKIVQPAGKAKEEDKKALTENKTDKKSIASKKRSFFFISASGGPDVSFTNGDALGRMKFTGGAGIGYTFKERFTLRTGFYSGRKVYTASPDQYHGNSWFYQYYPNLQKVEANCKIYEIPLALNYQFGSNARQNWFASAGVSTLLMKEETYHYYYKYTPTSPVVSRQHTTYNKNRHFFSIMTLSAGYQRNMGKRVSITTEPYIKLPLKGVGNGEVKLNSTGILFSVSFRPFK
jgi:hypothetical protein